MEVHYHFFEHSLLSFPFSRYFFSWVRYSPLRSRLSAAFPFLASLPGRGKVRIREIGAMSKFISISGRLACLFGTLLVSLCLAFGLPPGYCVSLAFHVLATG
jgi:hypothetical protein